MLPQTRVLELLREGAARGGLTAFQRDAFERVMSLSRTPVTRVMVPRQRAAMIGRDWSRADVLRIARMAHFSRLPVYVTRLKTHSVENSGHFIEWQARSKPTSRVCRCMSATPATWSAY